MHMIHLQCNGPMVGGNSYLRFANLNDIVAKPNKCTQSYQERQLRVTPGAMWQGRYSLIVLDPLRGGGGSERSLHMLKKKWRI